MDVCHDGRETRFILGYEMSSTKFGFDATNLFKACIDRAAELPDTLITDGLAGFAKEHKGAMFKHGHPMVQHIRDVAICDRHASNQIYERLNGDIRMAIKRSRGFNSDNPALFGLWVVYHNFIKRHSSLGGATPAAGRRHNGAGRRQVAGADTKRRPCQLTAGTAARRRAWRPPSMQICGLYPITQAVPVRFRNV